MIAGGASLGAPAVISLWADAIARRRILACFGDGAIRGDSEDQELHVVVRRVARLEQVLGVGAHRPVVVLPAAVDARKGLLVQQAGQAIVIRGLAKHFHDQVLVIGGEVAVLVDRGDLVWLGATLRCDAFVTGHAKLEQLHLGIGHARQNALGDRTEILILKLLTLGRRPSQTTCGRRRSGPDD